MLSFFKLYRKVLEKPKNEVKDQKIEEEEFKPIILEDITVDEAKNGSLSSVSNCLYFYQRGGSVILRTQLKNRTEQLHHLTFEHKPYKAKGECEVNATAYHYHTFIDLRFYLTNESSRQSAGKFKVNATFTRTRNGFWHLVTMGVKFYSEPKKEFEFDCKHLETPIDFSYSCRDFEVHSKNQGDRITLKFNNLQIQPFNTRRVFAESFDCSTLFTLGTWMGFIVVFVFTLVVAIGAYSLIGIKTMDRFDNAKGKSIISVTAIDQ